MFVIIGIVVVIGAILGGYLMEHGNIRVLVQPAELIIIGGAALGTILIANPLHILKKIAGGIGGVFGSSKYGKSRYMETLKMLLRTVLARPQGRIDGAGIGQRQSGTKSGAIQIPQISEGSSRPSLCLRHHPPPPTGAFR